METPRRKVAQVKEMSNSVSTSTISPPAYRHCEAASCMLRALSRSRLPLLRAMSSSAPVVAPATSISLTSTEEAFVNHLDEFASNYQPPIECRIAGGWVRDKVTTRLTI